MTSDNQPSGVPDAIAQLESARDPGAAQEAYKGGVESGADATRLRQTFIRKMISFGLPGQAEKQAEELLQENQQDGVAWAVLAFTSGSRNDTSAALAEIATAIGFAPEDPFVQRTAGQLMGWYHVLGHPAELPDEALKKALDAIHGDFKERPAYSQAYDEAKRFYEEAKDRPADAGAAPEAGAPPGEAPRPLERVDPGTDEPYVRGGIRRPYGEWADDEKRDDDDDDEDEEEEDEYDDDEPWNVYIGGVYNGYGGGFGYDSGGYGYYPYASTYFYPYSYPYYYPSYFETYYDGFYCPSIWSVGIVPCGNRYVHCDRDVHRHLHFHIGHRDRYYGHHRHRVHGSPRTRIAHFDSRHHGGSGHSDGWRNTRGGDGGGRYYSPSGTYRRGSNDGFARGGSQLGDRPRITSDRTGRSALTKTPRVDGGERSTLPRVRSGSSAQVTPRGSAGRSELTKTPRVGGSERSTAPRVAPRSERSARSGAVQPSSRTRSGSEMRSPRSAPRTSPRPFFDYSGRSRSPAPRSEGIRSRSPSPGRSPIMKSPSSGPRPSPTRTPSARPSMRSASPGRSAMTKSPSLGSRPRMPSARPSMRSASPGRSAMTKSPSLGSRPRMPSARPSMRSASPGRSAIAPSRSSQAMSAAQRGRR